MSFQIDIQAVANFEIIQISHPQKGIQITIATKGGILNSWLIQNGEITHEFIDGNDFTNGWGVFEMNGFKSGKMNPFSCRLQNGSYQHQGNNFTIDKFYLGEHALHGIIYDAVYTIESSLLLENEASVVLSYTYTGTDKGYPFNYTIQLHWTISDQNKVSVQTIITNNSNIEIPMMDGWHPYFKLADTIESTILQFTNIGKLVYDKALLPTGEIIVDTEFDNGKKLAGLSLDDCYKLDPLKPFAVIENAQFKLVVSPQKNYPYLQVYTPDHRKSIAIENLSGAPNCFNNKLGLHYVKPQEQFILKTNYQLFIK